MSKTTYGQIREKPIEMRTMALSLWLNTILRKGGFVMEGDKREERKDIIVLDKGTDSVTSDNPGPEFVCCWFSLTPFRW